MKVYDWQLFWNNPPRTLGFALPFGPPPTVAVRCALDDPYVARAAKYYIEFAHAETLPWDHVVIVQSREATEIEAAFFEGKES